MALGLKRENVSILCLIFSGAEFFRLISIILNNFNIIKKPDENTKPYVNWPPCFAEIDSVVTGEPI